MGKMDGKVREELTGILFSLPFLIFFSFFVIYPIIYAATAVLDKDVWLFLVRDPLFLRSLTNSLIFVGVGVNVKMMLALLVSGLLTFRNRFKLVRILYSVFIFSWVLPVVTAMLGIRWFFNHSYGTANLLLKAVGLTPIHWLETYEGGLTAIILAHIWKYWPFWTLIFLAARTTISQEVYEAAEVDGASLFKRFICITIPSLKNIYLFVTMLSTIWVLGDFTIPWLLTGGAPGGTTHVAATVAYVYGLLLNDIPTGLVALMFLIPIIAVLLFIIIRMSGKV
jgi:multiple sugar transport system permease protein